MIGETIGGRYTIARLLGAGGMGSVYEAKHTGTGRRVALKVITGDLTKHPVLVARFGREARAAGVIDSQHIAQVLDVGEDDGRPFLVMEYLKGEDLQQLFTRIGPLPPDLAVRIAAQTCMGLAKAHASGIMHRDIKPGNIFLAETDGGERIVKLLDFGIAKLKMEEAQDISAAGLTGTGALIGTPLYMSPEQARGDKKLDFRTDIWSLGVVLYASLTGKTPHHDLDAIGALIIAICSGPGQPIQDLAPWVDPEIVAVVEKALALHAADRYQTADEMHRALRAIARNGAINIASSMLVPLTATERAFVALPATVRSSDVPSQPAIARSEPPRAASQPDFVVTPPAAAQRTPAHGSTLASGETVVDAVASTERAGQSGSPQELTTGAASSSAVPRVAPAPRSSRLPIALAGAAVLGLAAFGIMRFSGAPSAPAVAGASESAATKEATPPPAIAPAIDAAPSSIVVTPSGSVAEPTPPASAPPPVTPPALTGRLPVAPPKGGRPGRPKPYDPTKQM